MIDKYTRRKRRHLRIRKRISGTKDRPRAVVSRTLKHIYVQLVDDTSQKVLTGVSSLTPKIKKKIKNKTKTEVSIEVGKLLAEKAKKFGIENIVFDRNGYAFKGRIKALANAVREAGLKF